MSTTCRLDDNIIDKSDLQVCESIDSLEKISLGKEEKVAVSEKETKPPPTSDDLHILLKEQLDLLHCPFTWDLRCKNDYSVSRIEEKLEEIEEEGMFQWRTFILNLAISNEMYWKCEYSKAFEHQRKCEEIVEMYDSKGPNEIFYSLIKDALLHVTLACKCHLLFKTGIVEEARQVLQTICGFEDMVPSCKAAIWGIRAAYAMEFGYEGTKSAIEYSEKALELDPKQGEWYFLLGKSLGRIRRINAPTDIPEHRELKVLETAVQLTEIPSYIIFLAQAYREAAGRVFSLNKYNLQEPQKSTVERMNQRSADLYKKALELRSDCTHINIRCALGFSKLPYPYKNIKLAQECCIKALKLAPNNAMSHHAAGTIAERFENDLEKAKKHYKIAGEQGAFGAYMDLFRLKYNEDDTYNPIPDLESLLIRYTEVPRTEETLCQLGSYYFFIKDDLITAVRKYWSKVIEQNPDSDKLKNHRCDFLRMRKPVNIYDCMFDEARLVIQNNTAGEDLEFFEKIILDHKNKFPDSEKSTPKDRRQIAIDEATNVYQSRSRPMRGRGRGGVFHGRSRDWRNGQREENQSWRQDYPSGRGNYQQGGRSLSREGRYASQNNRHTNQNYNRDPVGTKYTYGVGSRDSSSNSREKHQSKERSVRSEWQQKESTHQAGVSSHNFSIGRRDGNHSRERNYSTSSIESSSDIFKNRTRENRHYDRSNRRDEQHTHSTRSTSSFGSPTNSLREWTASDTQRDHGGGDRNRSSESGKQTYGPNKDTCREWKKGCSGGDVKSCTENNDYLKPETASESSRRKENFNTMWKGVDDSHKGFLRGPMGRGRIQKISDHTEEAGSKQ